MGNLSEFFTLPVICLFIIEITDHFSRFPVFCEKKYVIPTRKISKNACSVSKTVDNFYMLE